jgi:hypothetical protein
MARNLALADLNAVRTAIGAELRKLYSGVLREETPDKIAEQLSQLKGASSPPLERRSPIASYSLGDLSSA